MADRKNLREKATSAGKSIAGTLSKGAKKLKEKAQRSDDGLTLSYNSETGRYILFDEQGDIIDQFDTRKEATARVREIKRRANDSEVAQSDGNFATGFSRKVNQFVAGSSESDSNDDDEPGRFQQFATNFAESVNESVSGKATQTTPPQGQLVVRYIPDDDVWQVVSRNSDYGKYVTKAEAIQASRNVYNRSDQFDGVQVETKDGTLQQGRSIGEINQGGGMAIPGVGGGGGQPTLAGGESERGEPMLPGFGFQDKSDTDQSQPTIPGMGMGMSNDEPQIPGAMGVQGDENERGEPMLPGMFGGSSDDDDDSKPPWMM